MVMKLGFSRALQLRVLLLGAKIRVRFNVPAGTNHIGSEKNPEPQSSGLNPPVEGGGDKLCRNL
jgi:hypothetical protein